MAAAKDAEIIGKGVITWSSSLGLTLSVAGESDSTIVGAGTGAERESRVVRKMGEGKCGGSGE